MSLPDADTMIRVTATLAWVAIGVFVLAMALDPRGRDD